MGKKAREERVKLCWRWELGRKKGEKQLEVRWKVDERRKDQD